MRHWKTTFGAVVVALALAVAAVAQSTGSVNGSVENAQGQPWQGVAVTLENAKTNAHFATTTGADGKFSIKNVPAGNYTLTFTTDEYGAQPFQVQVKSGSALSEDLNFQKLIQKNPKLAEQLKKQAQFVQLKKHFTDGLQAINQAKTLQAKLNTEPAAQQSATQQQITQLSQTAANDFQQAQQVAAPNDANMPTILGNLALAYEMAGKHDQAATTFAQASQLKPTDPGLLLGAATNLAYSGKIQEASADCDKAVAISPQSGGTCWRNIGVVLYNTSQMKAAVEPLQKATQADPSDADTWYLLGESLMNDMQSKMVNGKLTAVVAPGTAEAFQKYLQLAPNGPQAANAKQALAVLQQLGGGVKSKFVAPGGSKSKKTKP